MIGKFRKGDLSPFSLLKYGIVFLVGVIVYYVFKRRGITGLIGDVIGVSESGASVSTRRSQEIVKGVEKDLAASGVSVMDKHKAIANTLFSLVNETHLNPVHPRFWTQNLYVDTQLKAVAEMLRHDDPGNYNNLRAVFVAYGVRVANNRQNALLGFLWDKTEGSLFDHVSWYFDDRLPVENKYLGDVHPANVKSLILELLFKGEIK